MNINALKNMTLDRIMDIEEAVIMSADARSLAQEYEELEIPVPDWLTKATDVIREEIARRTRAESLNELKKLELEVEGYKTVNEKRDEARRRIGDLQKKLGLAKTAAK